MNLTPLQIGLVVGILVAVAIVIYLVMRSRRSARLRTQFGPEYERAVSEGGDRGRAEASLAKRAERVKSYHLRPLAEADRASFLETWNRDQALFVDSPAGAVAEADHLLGQVMSARGYPVLDFEQRAADISVDHPGVVQTYRTAHEIAVRHASGHAGTEDLRRAMIHYRALFEELVTETSATTRTDGVARDTPATSERRSKGFAA